MSISPEKQKALLKRMEELNISEKELEEKFILGSGRGGQKINRTSSCVSLKHLPSNIVIKCQASRSRELNRYYARKELCVRLEQLLLGKDSKKEKELEKIRKQKKRRSRRSNNRPLNELDGLDQSIQDS